MAARAGMADLILHARRMANVGTADTTTAGTTWWNDDQIETILDRYRSNWRGVELTPMPDYISGTTTYTDYRLPVQWKFVEGTATGWALRTSAGDDAPSYTVNLDAGVVTFANDTAGTAYYATCRTYDLYRAVADIWEQKAGFVAVNVDWSSDNHRIAASQEQKAYMAQAKRYREMAGPKFSRLIRVDEA